MYGLIANVLSDKALRTGAKVWISHCNGDAEHPVVYGLNKSGRMVEKFTNYKRLTNFRAAWIPDHWRERISIKFETKDEAARYADALRGNDEYSKP